MSQKIVHTMIASPFGELTIVADDAAIREIGFPGAQAPAGSRRADRDRLLAEAVRQLSEYFQGSRREFDLPLAPQGTAFQMDVWKALRDIPYGVTISYGELAERLGNPAAVRAVGAANGRNPIAIVVPCHRVIGSDGTLTGYAGGLHVKEWLLELEGSLRKNPQMDLFG